MNKSLISVVAVLSLLVASDSWAQQGSGFKFLEVKVVDPEGKPVADATIDVTIDAMSFPMPTDDEGMISLNVPSGPNSSLQLKVQKDGFAAVSGAWGAGEEIPAEIEIALAPGIEIGGIVHDEGGNPVEGVTVEVQGTQMIGLQTFASRAGRMQSTLSGQVGTTDAEGRWHYRGASEPQAAQKVTYYIHLSHPNYAADDNRDPYAADDNRRAVTFEQLRAMDHVLVLEKGIELRGTVSDTEGNPVVGAKVALGSDLGQKDQTGNTDAEGAYLIGNVPAGSAVITVYSPDFAPDLRVVAAQKGMDPVDFQLKKGKPMRIRVTDPEGNAIANVGVVADTWRGYRTLYQLGQPERTDASGLCVWENAPADPMTYDFWHDSHMSLRGQTLTAGDEQHEIVLEHPVVVKGTVVDANTGLPIPLFNAVEGIRWDAQRTDIYWERYDLQAGRDGKFEMRFTEPRGAHLVRIETHGYKPMVSREIKDGEGEVTLEFQLEPGTGPSGIVKLPDGSPATGAQVAMASSGGQLYIQNGTDLQQDNTVRVTADESGKYQLPFPDADYVVVFLHVEGWAQATGAVLEVSPDVTLNKWARLEGVVKVGDRPQPNEQVNISFNNVDYNQSGPNVYWNSSAQTDDEGEFAFERLRAGDASVGRLITFGMGQMRMSTFSHSVPVALKAGETTQVQIGGSGRQVRGTITVPADYDGPNPWAMGQVQLYSQQPTDSGVGTLFFQLGRALAQSNTWQLATPHPRQQSTAPRRSYAAIIDQDGNFAVEDVDPGKYSMNSVVYAPPVGENYSWDVLGSTSGMVHVPEDGEGPVNVGSFELKLQPRQPTRGATGTIEVRAVPAK